MFALRPVARRSAVLARTYAEAAPAAGGKALKLSLVMPHTALFSSSEVTQVIIPASNGSMGILAGHVPTIEALKPGVIEVIEGQAASGRKWFVSSGFATVHPNNSLTINAVEAYDLGDFDAAAIKSQLEAAKTAAASSSSSEVAKAEANIEIDVLQILQASVKA